MRHEWLHMDCFYMKGLPYQINNDDIKFHIHQRASTVTWSHWWCSYSRTKLIKSPYFKKGKHWNLTDLKIHIKENIQARITYISIECSMLIQDIVLNKVKVARKLFGGTKQCEVQVMAWKQRYHGPCLSERRGYLKWTDN